MKHSNPVTSFEPATHIAAKASVVQGSRKNPISGMAQLSNARLSQSLNSQTTKSAKRGEMRANRTTKQPMGAAYCPTPACAS